jgi:hypothetical protein
MKKWFIAGLALLAAFAFFGCKEPAPSTGGGPDDGKKPGDDPGTGNPLEITITFMTNYSDVDTAAFTTVKLTKPNLTTGIALGDKMPSEEPAPKSASKEFGGWYRDDWALGSRVTAADTFTADTTLYAYWGNVGKVTVILNSAFYGSQLDDIEIEITKGASLTANDLPKDSDTGAGAWKRAGFLITGGSWYTKAAHGDKSNAPGNKTVVPTSATFNDRTTLYLKWKLDTAGQMIEKITLENAWYAVYRFQIPSNRSFADYKGIKADYMLDQDTIDTGRARGDRIYGNYTLSLFEFVEASSDANGGNKAVTTLGQQAIYVANSSSGYSSGPARGSLADALGSAVNETIREETWYTLDKAFPSGDPGSDWSADRNKPKPGEEYLYFGVGLPGQGDGGNTFLIRNVIMYGASASIADIKGVPAIFEIDEGYDYNNDGTISPDEIGWLYPAFVGYPNVNAQGRGTDGYQESKREYIGSERPDPISHKFALYDITLDYNWPDDSTRPLLPEEPAPKTVTTQRNASLTAGDLLMPSIAIPKGYKFNVWATAAEGTTGVETVTASREYTSDTTIYARWTVAANDPAVSLVWEGDDLNFSVTGSNNKATRSGNTATFAEDGDWALMTSRAFSAKINDVSPTDTNDTLASVAFPDRATLNAKDYTRVVIYYEAVAPSTIVAKDGTTQFTTTANSSDFYPDGNTGATMAGNMKAGFESWNNVVGAPQYPDFEAGQNKSVTFDYAIFKTGTNPPTGLSIQFNPSSVDAPKIDGWLFKITKIEFTTRWLLGEDS